MWDSPLHCDTWALVLEGSAKDRIDNSIKDDVTHGTALFDPTADEELFTKNVSIKSHSRGRVGIQRLDQTQQRASDVGFVQNLPNSCTRDAVVGLGQIDVGNVQRFLGAPHHFRQPSKRECSVISSSILAESILKFMQSGTDAIGYSMEQYGGEHLGDDADK